MRNLSGFLSSASELKKAQEALDQLKMDIYSATSFVRKIEEGELNTSYPDVDENKVDDDSLSGALIKMRNQLKVLNKTEEERKWVTEGLAFFGDVLRNNQQGLEETSDQIVSNLVKYVNANQGAIYIVNNDEKVLEQKACYAYERKKFHQKSFGFGEGLVGQVYLEKETLLLLDVPEDYISITSGLGKATPRAVILVPLKVNDVVSGIIELASFRTFEPYQIEFMEKLGESIASVVSTIRVNEKTQHLLEESQQQSEALRAQEEELRQNMEELEATQEETQRKSQEIESRVNAIDESGIISIEFDLTGNVTTANKNFLGLMDYSLEEIRGKHHKLFVSKEYAGSARYNAFWSALENGEAQMGEYECLSRVGDRVYMHGSYSIIKDKQGNPKNIIKLAVDVTASKLAQEEMEKQAMLIKKQDEELHEQLASTSELNHELDARMMVLNESTILSESDLYGTITYINDKFCEVSQFTREELIGKPHKTVRHPDTPKAFFKEFWKTIQSGKVFRGVLKNKKKDGSPYYVDAVIAPVLGEDGKPVKYIAARYVIEDVELAERLLAKQEVEMQNV